MDRSNKGWVPRQIIKYENHSSKELNIEKGIKGLNEGKKL
jgi:hypothetical protein